MTGLLQQAEKSDRIFAVSALTGEGVPRLLDAISVAFEAARIAARLMLGFADGRRRAWLHDEGVVTVETQTDDGWRIEVLWTERQAARYAAL